MNTEQNTNDDGFAPASYKIRVNGKDHILATPEPSVQSVIELTGEDAAGHMVIEMAKGQEKRILTLDADIDLRTPGIEEFVVVATKPEYIIYIDGTQVIFYTPHTNGLELLQKVNKKPGDFALAQLIPGAENEFIEPYEKVILALPGIEKFVTVVLDKITIKAPNGAEMTDKYRPHDTVSKTLEHAVKEFAKDGHLDPQVSYVLVLGETALEGSFTLEKAGVTAGAILKIRSKAIPGDGHASRTE